MTEHSAKLRALREQSYTATRRATAAANAHMGLHKDTEHVRALWAVARIAQEDHHAARIEVIEELPITYVPYPSGDGYVVKVGVGEQGTVIGTVWKQEQQWIGSVDDQTKVTVWGQTRHAVAVQLREKYMYGED